MNSYLDSQYNGRIILEINDYNSLLSKVDYYEGIFNTNKVGYKYFIMVTADKNNLFKVIFHIER